MPKTISLTDIEVRQLRNAIWTACDVNMPDTDIDILDDILDRLRDDRNIIEAGSGRRNDPK